MTVAVLALQGAFAEHAAMLDRLGRSTLRFASSGIWNVPLMV